MVWTERKGIKYNKARKRTRRRTRERKTAAMEGNKPKPSHPPHSQVARSPTLNMAGGGAVSDTGDSLWGGGGEGDSSKSS
jgi:hypothetical protein